MSAEKLDWKALGKHATRSAWQTLIIVVAYLVIMYLGAYVNDHTPR